MTGTAMALTADGRFFASTSGNSVNLWDTRTGRRVRTYTGLGGLATTISLSPDGRQIAANASKEIIIWDLEAGREQTRFRLEDLNLNDARNVNAGGFESVAFSADGRRLVFAGHYETGSFLTPSFVEYSGGVIDISSRRVISKLRGPIGRTADAAPNGKFLAIGLSDGNVQLLGSDGQSLRLLGSSVKKTYSAASAIAFAPDSRLLAVSVVNDDVVQIWNVESGTLVRTVPVPDTGEKKVYQQTALAWSPDGRHLATLTHGMLRIWDSATGRLAKSLSFPKAGGSFGVKYANDGKSMLVFSSVDAMRLDTESLSYETFSSRNVWSNPVSGQGAKDDEVIMVAQYNPCTLVNLDTLTGNLRYFYRGGEACGGFPAMSEGAEKFIGILSGTLLEIDLGAARGRKDLRATSAKYPKAAISADGTTVAFAQQVDAKNYRVEIIDEATGSTRKTIQVPSQASSLQPTLSRDGKRLVVPVAHPDRKVRLWDTTSGRLLATTEHPTGLNLDYPPSSVVASPDGNSLLYLQTGQPNKYGFEHRSLDGLKLIRKFGLENNNGIMYAAAFHPNGKQIAVGSFDGLVRLWDLNTGRLVRTFSRDRSGPVQHVLFKSNGHRIVSAGSGDGLKVWDTESGELLLTFYLTPEGDWLKITPEGFFDASDRGATLLTAVRGLESFSIEQIYQSLYRPDLVREKLAGDPRGLVRTAAASLDLNKVIASGNAPDVRVTLPGRGTGAADATSVAAQADISDTGGGIGRIEWRVNGVTAGIDTPVSGAVSPLRLSRSLALDPGDNAIEVVAYNAANLIASVPARITIAVQAVSPPVTPLAPAPGTAPPAPPPVAAAKPRLFVLVAGVNDYADSRFKLAYAVSDAKEVARGFKEASGGLYESVEVKLMTDHDVTRDRLDAAFAEMAGKTAASDVFVLYLAGHGKTVDGRYHFIPQDFVVQGDLTDKAINDAVKAKAIAQDLWQRWFASVPARKSVILFDTCDSGTLAGDETQQLERTAANDRLAQATGRSILAASGGNEAALEGYRGHGLFTYQLLDSINQADGNRNGTIELNELAAYVYGQVAELSQKVFKQRQVPQMKIIGNYPIARQVRILQDETTPVAETKPTYQVAESAQLQVQPSFGATVVRSLAAKTSLTVLESRDGWSLVASEGKPIGYVATRDLTPVQ